MDGCPINLVSHCCRIKELEEKEREGEGEVARMQGQAARMVDLHSAEMEDAASTIAQKSALITQLETKCAALMDTLEV